MRVWKKITGLISVFLVFFISMPSLVWAQSSLDAIEAKLNAAGISVIDYSAPENKWGSLPPEWIIYTQKKYDGIAQLAQEFDSAFNTKISLIPLNDSLALAEAEKTQLTLASEIQKKEEEIKSFRISLLQTEAATKKHVATFIAEKFPELLKELYPKANSGALASLIDDLELTQTNLLELEFKLKFDPGIDRSLLSQQKADLEKQIRQKEAEYEKLDFGVDLLFNEIKSYYSYSQWGPLPSRIVGILELNQSSFKGIQDLADSIIKDDETTMQQGFDTLRQLFSTYEGLSSNDIDLIIDSTKIYIAGGAGEAQLNQVGLSAARGIQNVAGALAILWIVIAGIRMIFAGGDETVIEEQKTAILYGVIGLALILLAGRLVETLYGTAGANRSVLTPDEGFSNEVYGIVAFFKAIVGVVAIFFIVLSGIRTLFAQGDEGEITKQRTSILWVGAGLVLIAINEIVIKNIFVLPASQSDQITTSNIAQIINTVSGVLKFILGFVGLITLGILVYGAATMIMNYGNDEMVENSKKIIRNAIIGILIILSAYVIVASLVTFS